MFAAGLEADGGVRAVGVRVTGQLDLREAKLRNGDGAALNLDGAEITGSVHARGLEADGEVRALGVHIGRMLASASQAAQWRRRRAEPRRC